MASELSEFFKVLSEEKKKKKEEFDSLVGDIGLDSFFEEIAALKSNKKKKGVKTKIEEPEEIPDLGNMSGKDPIPFQESISIEKNDLVEKSLGLLSEPSEVKQQKDPLTPLDQKFATLDDLQNHYKLFLTRIQQQLSTLGGGGETNLTYMDVPVTSVTTSSYTVKVQDYYIGVNYAGAASITLPKADREGKIFVVKDELGEASKGTNRYITVLPTGSDLIDGRDRAILAYDYGSLTFIWKGNSWRVI